MASMLVVVVVVLVRNLLHLPVPLLRQAEQQSVFPKRTSDRQRNIVKCLPTGRRHWFGACKPEPSNQCWILISFAVVMNRLWWQWCILSLATTSKNSTGVIRRC
uniref:Putative secreted protein n=1 Tax=Anopheles triannulatus TaxID=58253 RepID=A0A2M4B0R6_9DIPT